MANEAIHFILSGGTIDSYYDGRADTAVTRRKSIIPEYLGNMKLYGKIKFTQVCMKDSRQLTSKDLSKILKAVEKSRNRKIIITHGTYTMPDTARFLKKNLKRHDQTIILTGAMIPMDGFTFSDGPFNLGFAVSQVQMLKPGVYVCMNGRMFAPEEVVKTLYEGRFSSILGEK